MIQASAALALQQILAHHLHSAVHSFAAQPVGGGSINHSFRITVNHTHHFFCKLNSAAAFPGLFEKEKKGLELLGAQSVLRVPVVVHCGEHHDVQFLLLEWIEQGPRSDKFWQAFGTQLAALHHRQQEAPAGQRQPAFGLPYDNYMGALPQHNGQLDSWIDFFIQRRLQPQLEMALRKGLLQPGHAIQFEKLYACLTDIFPPAPAALLHGDLWSGNYICDVQERPVLIDPAVYAGHAAVDLGMTTLFGGFDSRFYEAYNYHSPFPSNYREQWEICNLYPLLIHLNLFGSGYRHDIEAILKQYAAMSS